MFKSFMFVFLLSGLASANNGVLSAEYLTLKKVTVTELGSGRSVTRSLEEVDAQRYELSNYVNRQLGLDQIVNLGFKIWDIVKANQPVLNFKNKSAMAIPQLAGSAEVLTNWGKPVSKNFRVSYENGLGFETIGFEYKVIFTPHGSFDGRGQYIANASVHPYDISVGLGYEFNAEVEVGQLLNVGTANDPLAGMQININWDVNTMLKKNKGGDYYFVQGDGSITVL